MEQLRPWRIHRAFGDARPRVPFQNTARAGYRRVTDTDILLLGAEGKGERTAIMNDEL